MSPQLLNVVRELAIAANIPMPAVYIIDDTAPNAFATGRDPAHASIAITTGLLEKLDREELQGVIGHELSHVRNLDIRFSLIVGVMVGAIAILADFFLRFTFWGGVSGRSRDRDGGGGGAQAIVFVIAIVLAILAPIISRFIQLAVSRQREYLADASAVELTRNPYGLERRPRQDRRRPGGPRGRQPRDPAHVLHEPDQEVRGTLVGSDVDPSADPRPDQPAARADRRGAAGAGRVGEPGGPRVGERTVGPGWPGPVRGRARWAGMPTRHPRWH